MSTVKSPRDALCGALCIAVGMAAALFAPGRGPGDAAAPGPGLFAVGLGAVLALLGAALLFKALTIESDAAGHRLGPAAWGPALAVPAAVALFAVWLPQLGWPAAVLVVWLVAGSGRLLVGAAVRRSRRLQLAIAAVLLAAVAATGALFGTRGVAGLLPGAAADSAASAPH